MRRTLALALILALTACTQPATSPHDTAIRDTLSEWGHLIDHVTGDTVIQVRTTLPRYDDLSKGPALAMCQVFEAAQLPEEIVGMSVNSSSGHPLAGCVR